MYVRRIAYDQLSMKQWLTTMVAVGAAIGALVAGAGGYAYYKRAQHGWNWTHATATVSSNGQLCHMSRRSGKRWLFVDAIDCQIVDAFIAENPDRKWKSSPVNYATVEYEANGATLKQLVQQSRVSAQPVTTGQKLAIFVNPRDSTEIDRPIADVDFDDFMITAYIGLAIVAGTTLFGALLGWFSERKRRQGGGASA